MKGSWEAALAAARVRVEFLRKCRREEGVVVGEGFCMGCKVATGWWECDMEIRVCLQDRGGAG